jgi:hypothetical protein
MPPNRNPASKLQLFSIHHIHKLTIKIVNILQDGYVTRDLFGAQASVCKWMELDREIFSSASHGAPNRRLAFEVSRTDARMMLLVEQAD